MNLSDKMSYLKGLVDGMELDLTTKEGKVLGQLLDVLQETVLYVTDLQDQVDELTELCESLDEDLGDVEDAVFGDEEDDEDEADEFEDDDDDYDDDDDDMYSGGWMFPVYLIMPFSIIFCLNRIRNDMDIDIRHKFNQFLCQSTSAEKMTFYYAALPYHNFCYPG